VAIRHFWAHATSSNCSRSICPAGHATNPKCCDKCSNVTPLVSATSTTDSGASWALVENWKKA